MAAEDLEPMEASAAADDAASSDSAAPTRKLTGRLALALALAALVVAASLALVLRDGQPSPEESLADVRAFVKEHGSARFTGKTESSYGDGDEEIGSTSVDRSRLEGEFVLPDTIRMLDRSSYGSSEYLQVDGRMWHRFADEAGELPSEKWVFGGEVEESAAGSAAVPLVSGPGAMPAVASASGFFASVGSPLNFDALFGELSEIERLEPGVLRGASTVGELLPPGAEADMREGLAERRASLQEAEAAGEKVYPGDIERSADDALDEMLAEVITVTITHDHDGRLDRLLVESVSEVDGGKAETKTDVAFTAWGEDVRVTPPQDHEVDHTPTVDELALSEFSSFPLAAPARIPRDWLLRRGEVVAEDLDFGDCGNVTLAWSPRDELERWVHNSEVDDWDAVAEPTTIEITMADAGCEHIDDTIPALDEGEPTSVGGRPAALHSELDEWWFSYLSSGAAVVFEADGVRYAVSATHLSHAELRSLAADLRPFELSAWQVADGELVVFF